MVKKKRDRPLHPEGPRKAAWQILLTWQTGSDALEAIRSRYFERADPDPRDRALITELTQGTVRHLLDLDHTIENSLDQPQRTLPPPVLTALRIGVYQLTRLDKIPAHAAVKETVQLIKDSRYRRFSALVNAVLRRVADSGPAPIPALEEDPVRHLELAASTPRWLVERLIGSHGVKEAGLILQALNRPPALSLRVNTSRISRGDLLKVLQGQGVGASPGKLSETGIILLERTPLAALRPLEEGLCTVQDEGAQLIAPLLDPLPGQKVLDACAAPGGKTGHLAQMLGGQGLVVSADRNLQRVRMTGDTIRRLKVGKVLLLTADLGTGGSPLADGSFHRVLLDAPCSGTGVLRRHPEGKWKKDPATISRMTAVQEDLLVSVSRALKRGGLLLYATCSILEEENEKVTDRFLSGSTDFVRLDMRARFPEMHQDIFSDRGELRLWPHIHDCDGFFACLMEKKN